MCGILGWVNFGPEPAGDPALAESMLDTIECRGPDERGRWTDGRVTLAHTRLAVIDIAGSRQPMRADEDGRPAAVLTFSGEIYNFRALRAELRAAGHRFDTAGDTEVILRAYQHWGERCVERLDGMFAFAVWDHRREQLFLARDRLGIKPLHYARIGGTLVFASEPKALLQHPGVAPVVDADGLREVFSMARTPGRSVFRDIRELMPATTATVSAQGMTQRRYWRLPSRPHTPDLAGTVGDIGTMLAEIVDRELVADVPVALLLSGGLDSSTLTALAACSRRAAGGDPVRSITVTYDGYRDNFQPDLVRSAPDDPYAQLVAEHVGSRHREISLRPAELADPHARLACLLAQDKPTPFGDMDTSTYLAFRAVREHCSVALIGEVADEIFGGYSWVHITDLAEQPMYPWVSYEQWHPGTRAGLGRGLFDPGLLTKLDLDTYYADGYRAALAEIEHPGTPEPAGERRAREICYLHLTRWLPMLLDRIDRLSSACGLEVRVPFCDHRLVEYLYNVPWAMKTFDGREKSLLRAAAGHLLPAAVLDRPKSPFPVSQDPAYSRALYAALADTLRDQDAPVTQLIDRGAAQAMLDETPDGQQDWLYRMNVEMVLQFNSWLQAYHIRLAL